MQYCCGTKVLIPEIEKRNDIVQDLSNATEARIYIGKRREQFVKGMVIKRSLPESSAK